MAELVSAVICMAGVLSVATGAVKFIAVVASVDEVTGA